MNAIRVRRASICYFIIASLTLGIVTPVLAAYLGPSRVVTEYTSDCKIILNECQYVPSKDRWNYKKVDDWSCSNEGKPWKAYDSDPSPWGCSSVNEGHTYWSREETLQEVTNTYPPATISSALQNCTLNNGWCNTAPVLSLGGIEPVAGYNILAIEGTRNGQTFACAGTNCNVALIEGNNSFSFWALSSWGDTSEMGALNAKVDSQLPTITGTLSGSRGSNGWYLGSASLINGSASDSTSGVASFSCTLDGSALPSCNSFTINSPGTHTILLTARDNAGNTRTLNQSVSIDTQSPVLNANITGTLGSNNWYNAATLNASASDPTPGSGLATFEYSQDGSGWATFPTSGELALPEGKHSIDIRAMDNAGQTVLASKSFWLDTVVPTLLLNSSGTLGANNWYTSSLSVAASASDVTSGIDLFEYQLNSGSWVPYQTALDLGDGIHTLKFWAQDVSGLVSQESRTYQIDTHAPQISGSLSGVLGANGWYISNVTLSASASDPTPGSGLDTFTYTLDNTPENSYTGPLTIGDGRHTIELNAQDEAGLADSMEQSFKVDTLVPTLSLQSILPGWINGNVALSGTANDPLASPGQPGSGLSKVEVSTDGGQVWQSAAGNSVWSYTWNTEENTNGTHTVYLRVTDNAGLRSQQTFAVGVDNSAPKISLPESWYQWDTVPLDIWDNHSGLSEARIEISDPEGRWPARKINLDLDSFPMDFKWDRRFGDGTVAPLGTYDVDVFAFDRLGNAARESASVNILLGILPAGPTSTAQPYVRPESTPLPITTSAPLVASAMPATEIVSAFGATPEPVAQETPVPDDIPSARETPAQTSVLDWLQSVFLPDAHPTTEEVVGTADEAQDVSQSAASDSSVLWGATATAMIGAATAYALDEKRKREEEIERNRAAIEARIEEQEAKKIEAAEARKVAQWLEGQELLKEKQLQAAIQAAEMSDVTDQERLAVYKQSAQYQAQQERMENWQAQQAKLKAAETADITAVERLAEYKNSDEYKERQAALEEYHHDQRVQSADAARWAGLASQGEYAANVPGKSWWEKAIDWADDHQAEIALGFGAVVGVAAIILSGGVATPLVAAAWMAGAAAVAGGTIALGTIGLNAYYGRDWNENVVRNLIISGITAAAISGVGFLLSTPSMITMGTSITEYCATHQNICSRVDVALKTWDTMEEVGLIIKGTVQTITGDSVGAAETHFELQMEYLDGGIPGNTMAVELGEQIAKLGDDATELIAKHGDDILPLLLKYGDDAVDIIGAYGDEGISLLRKFGDQGDEVIRLIREHGTPAVTVLNAADPASIKKLFANLDDDVLDYAFLQGLDAVDALSKWDEKLLKQHGPELALRATKDAEVLSDVQKLVALGPIDPKNLTKEQKELIDAIAANSTFYADGGQAVLGKWVGFSDGYAGQASATGSIHYYPHQEMWNMLGDLGKEQQAEVAWLINKQAIQPMIDQGLPIEYTLNGIKADDVNKEIDAIDAIWSGATDSEIKRALQTNYLPGRMKELQELYNVGYQLTFDSVNNSYILIKP